MGPCLADDAEDTLTPRPPISPDAAAWPGLQVLQRGWLSSNNVLLHGGPHDAGALMVDSGHVRHAEQTVALLRHALAGQPLARLVNTHLHGDHCGGNAAVQRVFGCRIETPPGHFEAVRAWDEAVLSYRATGQLCERFTPDAALAPGDTLAVGPWRFEALAAPGHDPHSLLLFDARQGVLISADALWENGFGVVFPELDGEAAFDEVGATLDLIERLAPRWVIPGHGSPFGDVGPALQRARHRLAGFVADPARHARHGLRVLVKYHLMEQREETWADYLAWFEATPLTHAVWQRLGSPAGGPPALARQAADELVGSGALAARDGRLFDVG